MLQEQDRTRLDSIVNQMVTNKESDANIQAVVNDFKSKYEKTPGPVSSPAGGEVIQGASNFVGTTGLGRGAAAVLAPDQTGDINRISESAGKFTKMADMLPANDPRRAKLLGLAKQTSGEAQTLSGENIASIPTNKEVIGSAVQTGLSLATLGGLGTGGGLGAQVLKGSAIGGGFGAAGALEANRTPTLGDIGTGAAVGGAIPLVGAGLSKLGSYLTETLPKRFVQSTLKPEKDITEFVLKNKKIGTVPNMLNTSKEAVKTLSGQIDGELASAAYKNIAINKNSLLKSVAQSYGQTGGGGTLSSKEIAKIIQGVAPQAKGLLSREQLTVADANRLRKIIDKTLGSKFFLATQAPFKKEVLGTFNDFLRETVKSQAPSTRPIFDELSKEITFRNAVMGLSKRLEKQKVIGFGDLVYSGLGSIGGGLAGGLPGGIAGGLAAESAKKIIQAPQTNLVAAKAFTKLGQIPIPQIAKQFTKLGALRATTSQ